MVITLGTRCVCAADNNCYTLGDGCYARLLAGFVGNDSVVSAGCLSVPVDDL